MNPYTAKVIIAVVGIIGISFATAKTRNANCLWALILIGLIVQNI